MSNEFNTYLNISNNNFIILKVNKKKTIFTIKDGYFKFKVDLKNLSCTFCKNVSECSLKKCKHIYYIYSKEFKISKYLLQFLWVNNNYINILEGKDMVIEEDDTHCPVCLDDSSKECSNFDKIVHCLDCGKFYHKNCLMKTKKKLVCLICGNNWKPNWMN